MNEAMPRPRWRALLLRRKRRDELSKPRELTQEWYERVLAGGRQALKRDPPARRDPDAESGGA